MDSVLSLYTCLQELANLRQGSSGEVDELKAQLSSTKEVLEADIKNKEEVQCIDHLLSCDLLHWCQPSNTSRYFNVAISLIHYTSNLIRLEGDRLKTILAIL